METYTELMDFVENPHYPDQRRKNLAGLTGDMIDGPILGIVNGFNRLPYCFTLQSCSGHFVFNGRKDPRCRHRQA